MSTIPGAPERLSSRVCFERIVALHPVRRLGQSRVRETDQLQTWKKRGEYRANLAELVGVAGGKDDRYRHGLDEIAQGGPLCIEEFTNPGVREIQHPIEPLPVERCTFGGALNLDVAAGVGHDDVHVHRCL